MIAIDPGNREKMIKIIADVLDMNATVSPLLKPIVERDNLMNEAQTALQTGDLKQAATYFEKIGDLCIEIGDDSLGSAKPELAQLGPSSLHHPRDWYR